MNTPAAEVLFVCTGNICRSPAAESLLRRHGGEEAAIASAGLHAMVGLPADPAIAKLVMGSGAEIAGFRAKQLTAHMVKDSSLVLTMTSDHRRAVVELAPTAVRRVFQLDEFAWLLGHGVTGDSIPELVAHAGTARARLVARTGFHPADIPDPYRRGEAAAQLTFAKIYDLIESIAPILYPPDGE